MTASLRDLAARGWLATFAVGLVLAIVAVWALPRTIAAGDAGELATVMLRGGVPHPSGYPWMRILGGPARLAWAMGLPPATAAALPCALAAIAGWMMIHRVAWHLTGGPEATSGGRSWLSAFSILLLALSPPVVLHAFDAEVWGPLCFFAGLVMHVAVVQRRGPFALGVALGLAVSHHLTGVLLVPLGVAGAWPARLPGQPRSAHAGAVLRAGGLGLLGSAVGLLPYLTLLLGSEGAWRWGDPSTLAGLVHHVSRADYGVLSLSLHEGRPAPLAQLARMAQSVGAALTAGILQRPAWACALPLVAVLTLSLRPRAGAGSLVAVVGLVASAVTSLVLFPLAHNIDPQSSFGAWILERFDILGLCLLAPLLARSLAGLPSAASRQGRAGPMLALAGVLLLLRQGVATYWNGVPSSDTVVQRYAIDLLRTPPPDRPAVIFGTEDHRTFGVLFAQEVLEHGPNVAYVDASLLAYPWYRQRLEAAWPWLPVRDKPVRMMNAIRGAPSLRDVPVYVANLFSGPAAALPRVPEGVLWRVLEPEGAPSLDEQLARHRAALQRYRSTHGTMMPVGAAVRGHPFASDLQAAYLERTLELAVRLREAGRAAEGEALLREARAGSQP